jgi:hypothetical protein
VGGAEGGGLGKGALLLDHLEGGRVAATIRLWAWLWVWLWTWLGMWHGTVVLRVGRRVGWVR